MNSAMASLFPLMIGSGMSIGWDAFSELSFSPKACSNETKLKLNFGLFILEILSSTQWSGWSLDLSMETFTLSAHKFEVWSAKQGSFETEVLCRTD